MIAVSPIKGIAMRRIVGLRDGPLETEIGAAVFGDTRQIIPTVIGNRQERQNSPDGADLGAEVVLAEAFYEQDRIAQTGKNKLQVYAGPRVGISRSDGPGIEAGGASQEAQRGVVIIPGASKHDGVGDAPFKSRQRFERDHLSIDPRTRKGQRGTGAGKLG